MNRWTLLGAAALLLGGFLLGRSSIRPDSQKVRDSLATYRAAKVDRERLVVTLLQDVGRLELAARASDSAAAAWRGRARVATRTADSAGQRADALEAQLATATTPRDSNGILLQACTERRNECAGLRTANAALLLGAAADSTTKDTLRIAIARMKQVRTADSTGLAQADRLIGQLKRSVEGCRVLGIPCPTATFMLDASTSRCLLGPGLPVRRWLTVSVTWQVCDLSRKRAP